MTEQDWMILRLLRAATPELDRLTEQAQRDYSRAFLYLVKKHGDAVLSEGIAQLRREEY